MTPEEQKKMAEEMAKQIVRALNGDTNTFGQRLWKGIVESIPLVVLLVTPLIGFAIYVDRTLVELRTEAKATYQIVQKNSDAVAENSRVSRENTQILIQHMAATNAILERLEKEVDRLRK